MTDHGDGRVPGWDPVVRVIHWTVAAGFLANLALTDPEGALHRWIGYAVAGAVALRLAWGFVGPRPSRFASFPPDPAAATRHLRDLLAWRRERPGPSHNPLGALMVYNLLATLAALGVTGWMMTTTAFWGVEWVEEAHEALADWGLVSVALHVAGVAAESLRTGTNLVRAMVTGWKTQPPTHR